MIRVTHVSAALAALAYVSITTSACTATGGPIPTTTADKHCSNVAPQATSQSVCDLTSGQGGGGASDSEGDDDYGATLDGNAGDDDDCKYHVSWSSTSIRKNNEITVTVVATNKTDGSPVTGAETIIESYLNETHPAPNLKTETVEGPPGTYKISPIEFDASGKWTMRFHLFEQCSDLDPRSPHGHAAFYVEVP